jgi:hypothetical protein
LRDVEDEADEPGRIPRLVAAPDDNGDAAPVLADVLLLERLDITVPEGVAQDYLIAIEVLCGSNLPPVEPLALKLITFVA